MTFSPGPASFIRGLKSASPANTRGGSRVPEWGPLGSVRGALSNERPYRDLRNVDINYPFERSHRFAGIQPYSGFGDHSRLSCSVGLKSVFLSARPIVLSVARTTMPSSTTLFSNNRKLQRARPLGGLEQARAISLASFSPSKIRATDTNPNLQSRPRTVPTQSGCALMLHRRI